VERKLDLKGNDGNTINQRTRGSNAVSDRFSTIVDKKQDVNGCAFWYYSLNKKMFQSISLLQRMAA
jgi:hypothetical protein